MKPIVTISGRAGGPYKARCQCGWTTPPTGSRTATRAAANHHTNTCTTTTRERSEDPR